MDGETGVKVAHTASTILIWYTVEVDGFPVYPDRSEVYSQIALMAIKRHNNSSKHHGHYEHHEHHHE